MNVPCVVDSIDMLWPSSVLVLAGSGKPYAAEERLLDPGGMENTYRADRDTFLDAGGVARAEVGVE